MVRNRVDMSKALHLAYTLHPIPLPYPLLAYNLTKPLQKHVFSQVFVVASQATLTNTVTYQRLPVVV